MRVAPLFVALEGIDNSGKTSLLDVIVGEFSPHIDVYVTRELSSNIGSYVLDALMTGTLTSMDKVLLFAADRQLRISSGFGSLLAQTSLCVADRWTLSAIAYRTAEDHSLLPYVAAVNSIFPEPDLTLLIDLPGELSLSRGAPINKNNYTLEYLCKVRERYVALANDRTVMLNGALPFLELAEHAITTIAAYMEKG